MTINVTPKTLAALAIKSVTKEGEFEGYASVFGTVDDYGDVVVKGAFAESLRKKQLSEIKLLWQHNPEEPIGSITELREDSHGLWFKGQLNLDVQRATEARSLMVKGELDGLSIGYRTLEHHYDGEIRYLDNVDLWEVSAVTFPAHEDTRILGAKSSIKTIREFESFLRDEGGFSKKEAKALAAKGFQNLLNEREAQKARHNGRSQKAAAKIELMKQVRQLTIDIKGLTK